MSGHQVDETGRRPQPREPNQRALVDGPGREGDELALALPAWDLLPVAEFVRRHRSGGE